MAKCVYCQTETILYVNGRPVCLSCSDDLDAGGHRAALGGLDGIEREIQTMRSFLLLLP